MMRRGGNAAGTYDRMISKSYCTAYRLEGRFRSTRSRRTRPRSGVHTLSAVFDRATQLGNELFHVVTRI